MSYDLILVRVWNDNDVDYRENFKGKDILIGPKKFIEMEMNEAVEFIGTFVPVRRDYDGQPEPLFFKKLRIEKTGKEVPKVTRPIELTCQACGFTATNVKELDAHIDANHLDSLVDEKEHDKRKKAQGKTVLT